jgi:hypothetical protein
MTELSPEVEQQLADMSEDDFDSLVARVRPPEEPADPKARAAQALRREMGVYQRGRKPTKEQAAAALHRYATNR